MRGQASGSPHGSEPSETRQTTLVLVRPGAAARGPAGQMRAQAVLVRRWTGPVVVLQEMDSGVATCRGAPLREALDAGAALRERAGSGYHHAPLAAGSQPPSCVFSDLQTPAGTS
jgi:hypothetical protein